MSDHCARRRARSVGEIVRTINTKTNQIRRQKENELAGFHEALRLTKAGHSDSYRQQMHSLVRKSNLSKSLKKISMKPAPRAHNTYTGT